MLLAISPIDGRYAKSTTPFQTYFSEFGLIRYRVLVEIEYFICLSKELKNIELTEDQIIEIKNIYLNFTVADAENIKEIERTTNHDVKAVEYFIKKKFDDLGLGNVKEWIHFGLTSQDINNTAIPLSIKEACEQVLFPKIESIINLIENQSITWKNIPLLARTHGQPASPTGLGKELFVFVERLKIQFLQLKNSTFAAKFGGATGNFNAHYVAFPKHDWVSFGNQFVNHTLQLTRSQTTTQIEHYDHLAAFFHTLSRINTILIDYARDIWTYISMDYFKQKTIKGEVGSSAMPHKVNPIDFENAEGNLSYANAIQSYFAEKLPISRLQRDLTDSTVLRNIGVPLSHVLVALTSLQKGISKLELNESKIINDLENNWMVVAEAIQTVLRRENYEAPYEALKELTRGNHKVTQEVFQKFIDQLAVNDKIKDELKAITPHNFTGNALNI